MSLKNSALVIISFLVLFSCGENSQKSEKFEVIQGEAQGTTYTIQLVGEGEKINKKEIDQLLNEFDASLSTYKSKSDISNFNNAGFYYAFPDKEKYFKSCLEKSQLVYDFSNGSFDPTVFTLIDAWGFYKEVKTPLLKKEQADSILKFVSFEKDKLLVYKFQNDSVILFKRDERLKLDFNAIAQGLAVDFMAKLIAKKGYKNFYIELGGEIRVAGTNKEGNKWRIGIDTPKTKGERSIQEVIQVSNKSVATSGNYRKFYEVNGVKYGHTIDPKTGMQAQQTLLSATVVMDECALADGFATAFMVMGIEKTKEFLKKNKRLGIEVLLIYNEKGKFKTYSTVK
jgi:thiamine biosynthesis lipoprotein